MRSGFKVMLALLLATLFFSTVPVGSKAGLKLVGPFAFLFIRFSAAFISFLPIFLKVKPWKHKNGKKLIFVALLNTINVIFFIVGVQFTSATASQIIYASLPLLILVFSSIIWKDKFPLRKVIGVIVGLAGILYIVYLSFVEKGLTISGSIFGNGLIIIAMLSWMFYILLSKKLLHNINSLVITGATITVTLIVSGTLFLIQSLLSPETLHIPAMAFLSAGFVGVVGTTGAYVLYQYGLKSTSALTASLTSYLQPIFSLIIAMFVLGEKLTLHFAYGSALVFAGIFIATTLELRHRRRSRSP